MNAISRTPRPRVVDKKSVRTPKKGLTLTELDLQDCADLKRAVDLKNRGRSGREKITDVTLAKYAGAHGGSRHPQAWADYRKGKRHIPQRDKMLGSLCLRKLPEDVFTSWERAILPLLMQVVAFATQMSVSAAGQETLGELIRDLARALPEQRKAILQELRAVLDSEPGRQERQA